MPSQEMKVRDDKDHRLDVWEGNEIPSQKRGQSWKFHIKELNRGCLE
jgi:hypothetical protein